MLYLTYLGEDIRHVVEVELISDHVVQVTGTDLPVKICGFYLSRLDIDDKWDYLNFKTVYRVIDNGVQYSDDGSEYVAPPEPEPPVPPLPPTPPTLEEVQETKVWEMNMEQQALIAAGVDVDLTDGTKEHFKLTANDQISLMGLQGQVAAGTEQIPWHTSDETKACKFYSNEDMAKITAAAMAYVTYHVTYFRDLRIYIRALQDKEAVEAVTYGMDIPEEYQSDVLKTLIAEQQAEKKMGDDMQDA